MVVQKGFKGKNCKKVYSIISSRKNTLFHIAIYIQYYVFFFKLVAIPNCPIPPKNGLFSNAKKYHIFLLTVKTIAFNKVDYCINHAILLAHYII